jgi:hypothetical protein
MVCAIGFDPANVPAYDSFLTTFISSESPNELPEAMEYLAVLSRRGCSPGEKFFRAALAVHLEARELQGAMELWNDFVGNRPGYGHAQYNDHAARQSGEGTC